MSATSRQGANPGPPCRTIRRPVGSSGRPGVLPASPPTKRAAGTPPECRSVGSTAGVRQPAPRRAASAPLAAGKGDHPRPRPPRDPQASTDRRRSSSTPPLHKDPPERCWLVDLCPGQIDSCFVVSCKKITNSFCVFERSTPPLTFRVPCVVAPRNPRKRLPHGKLSKKKCLLLYPNRKTELSLPFQMLKKGQK